MVDAFVVTIEVDGEESFEEASMQSSIEHTAESTLTRHKFHHNVGKQTSLVNFGQHVSQKFVQVSKIGYISKVCMKSNGTYFSPATFDSNNSAWLCIKLVRSFNNFGQVRHARFSIIWNLLVNCFNVVKSFLARDEDGLEKRDIDVDADACPSALPESSCSSNAFRKFELRGAIVRSRLSSLTLTTNLLLCTLRPAPRCCWCEDCSAFKRPNVFPLLLYDIDEHITLIEARQPSFPSSAHKTGSALASPVSKWAKM